MVKVAGGKIQEVVLEPYSVSGAGLDKFIPCWVCIKEAHGLFLPVPCHVMEKARISKVQTIGMCKLSAVGIPAQAIGCVDITGHSQHGIEEQGKLVESTGLP